MKGLKYAILVSLVSFQLNYFAYAEGDQNQHHQLIRFPDELVDYISQYLPGKDLSAVKSIAHDYHKRPLLKSRLDQENRIAARAIIRRLIGKLIKVKRGAFSYMDDTENPPAIRWVSVPHHFQMPENDITQEQYDLIASLINAHLQDGEQLMPTAREAMNPQGDVPSLVGPKKPMGGLKVSQWQRYLDKLNEVLASVWAYADSDQTAPVFRFPEEAELRLAMSDPLKKPKEGYVLHNGVPINAVFSTFSGANVPAVGPLTLAQMIELRSHVSYGKIWERGPMDVDDESILPNKRGFRSLSGNSFKLTSTSYGEESPFLTAFSCSWFTFRRYCRVNFRTGVSPENALQAAGLRPVSLIQKL